MQSHYKKSLSKRQAQVRRLVQTREAAAIQERKRAQIWAAQRRTRTRKPVTPSKEQAKSKGKIQRAAAEMQQTMQRSDSQSDELLSAIKDEFGHLILTQEQMNDVAFVRTLGEGGNGKVDLVRLEGTEMVMKTPTRTEALQPFLNEARRHKFLAGAGGAPLLQGLCLSPPRMFISCAGESYLDFLESCSDVEAVDSLVIVAKKLMDIHERGLVHNDLKADNVTFVTRDDAFDFNVIDFGLSRFSGQILYLSGEGKEWYAPELRAWDPCLPASDVYSYGMLIATIKNYFIQDTQVKWSLHQLYSQATVNDPHDRPTLQSLVDQLEEISRFLWVEEQ